MTLTNLKLALGICVAFVLLGGSTTVAFSQATNEGAGDNLSPSEILKNAQEKYASLKSYSDEGQTVAKLNGMTITTIFTIKMSRPNLYRIEWEQTNDSAFSTTTTKTQAVWSAGDGDFLEMAGSGAQKQQNQEMALASATGISGNAASTIPSNFFKLHWGDLFAHPSKSENQLADEKVGDVDCYVFAGELKTGVKRAFWIGKQDFLIHQVRTVTSAEAMKAIMDEAAKSHPEIIAHLPQSGFGVTSTETHTNIIENPNLTAADFAR